MYSKFRSRTPVSASMRAVTAFTLGSSRHAGVEHHVWKLVRTGLSASPARLRTNVPLACARMAAASSDETKSSNCKTYGSLLSTWGLYCGKLEAARSKRAERPPGTWVMAVVPSIRSQAMAISLHVLQLTGQLPRMYPGLFWHSPALAHVTHASALSLQSGYSSSVLASPSDAAAAGPFLPHRRQLRGHLACMNSGLLAHSPAAAQPGHSGASSAQLGSSPSGPSSSSFS
mmetsp:Transcript_19803/g.66589  ORF Transcript_19803/g.66589 Transcript_19803/m.66589 type:complete len:230 (-) Transcript_19803:254-943(-)